MSQHQFNVSTQPVTIKLMEKVIGSGVQNADESTIAVNGSYNWPPDSIAEVEMSFFLNTHANNVCTVEVNWPGLISAPIPRQEASYWVWLVLARPVVNVQTSSGDLIVFSYTGPPGDPEKITGFQISVMESGAQHATALTFVYNN
jgi:hypothetical protein